MCCADACIVLVCIMHERVNVVDVEDALWLWLMMRCEGDLWSDGSVGLDSAVAKRRL